eukprot:tig00001471_g8877.t1
MEDMDLGGGDAAWSPLDSSLLLEAMLEAPGATLPNAPPPDVPSLPELPPVELAEPAGAESARLVCRDSLDRAFQAALQTCSSPTGTREWTCEQISDRHVQVHVPPELGLDVDAVLSFLRPGARDWDPHNIQEEAVDVKIAENTTLVRAVYEGVGRFILAEFWTLDGLFRGPAGAGALLVRTSAPRLCLPQLGVRVPPGSARLVSRELPWSAYWVREVASQRDRFGERRAVLVTFLCKGCHEGWMNFNSLVYRYTRNVYRSWIARILLRSFQGLLERLRQAAAPWGPAAGLASVGALACRAGAPPAEPRPDAEGEGEGEGEGDDEGGGKAGAGPGRSSALPRSPSRRAFTRCCGAEDALKKLAEKDAAIAELRAQLEAARLDRESGRGEQPGERVELLGDPQAPPPQHRLRLRIRIRREPRRIAPLPAPPTSAAPRRPPPPRPPRPAADPLPQNFFGLAPPMAQRQAAGPPTSSCRRRSHRSRGCGRRRAPPWTPACSPPPRQWQLLPPPPPQQEAPQPLYVLEATGYPAWAGLLPRAPGPAGQPRAPAQHPPQGAPPPLSALNLSAAPGGPGGPGPGPLFLLAPPAPFSNSGAPPPYPAASAPPPYPHPGNPAPTPLPIPGAQVATGPLGPYRDPGAPAPFPNLGGPAPFPNPGVSVPFPKPDAPASQPNPGAAAPALVSNPGASRATGRQVQPAQPAANAAQPAGNPAFKRIAPRPGSGPVRSLARPSAASRPRPLPRPWPGPANAAPAPAPAPVGAHGAAAPFAPGPWPLELPPAPPLPPRQLDPTRPQWQ